MLAAAGAEVTVFDLSEGQLDQDRAVARREGLALSAVQGDMRDLSAFDDQTFDVVFHPISNLYVPDVRPVWRECARCGRAAGCCPASTTRWCSWATAIRDTRAGPDPAGAPAALRGHAASGSRDAGGRARGEALVFGHTLQDQIGGQLDAGFLLAGFHEVRQPRPRFVIDGYLPTFLATGPSSPSRARRSARHGPVAAAAHHQRGRQAQADRRRPVSAIAVPGPAGPSGASANGWCSGR